MAVFSSTPLRCAIALALCAVGALSVVSWFGPDPLGDWRVVIGGALVVAFFSPQLSSSVDEWERRFLWVFLGGSGLLALLTGADLLF